MKLEESISEGTARKNYQGFSDAIENVYDQEFSGYLSLVTEESMQSM